MNKISYKITVQKQIVFVFAAIALMLLILGALNLYNVRYSEESIISIRKSSIEQLNVIKRAKINTSILEITLFRYMLAPDPDLREEYRKQLYQIREKNEIEMNRLAESIYSQEGKIIFKNALEQSALFWENISGILNLSNEDPHPDPYLYEKEVLRPVFEQYQSELEALSDIIIKDSEEIIDDHLDQIGDIRRISNWLIMAGVIVLMIMSLIIIGVIKKLNSDYMLLKEESLKKQQAQEKIQSLNRELESKVETRTKELKQANQELLSFHTIIEMSENPVVIRDMNDRIVYWNRGAEKIYKCSKDDAVGKNCNAYFQRVFMMPYEEIKKTLFDTGNWQGEFYLITPSGTKITLSSRWTLQRDEKNIPVSILEIDHDISERIKMENAMKKYNMELKELNKEKNKIFSVISHDLRSPVNGLIGTSETLLNNLEILDKEEIGSFSDIIYRTSIKMLEQLNGLLEWAKQQHKEGTFNPKKTILHDAAEEAVKILQANAEQKNILLQNNIPKNLIAFADPNMLNSIFQNIISNAIKFTPPEGAVTVTANETQSAIEVCIKDTGIGMSPEEKSKLFAEPEPFSTTGTNHEKGSGLGLQLVKHFVEKHQGRIWIKSIPGEGTDFCFSLNKNPM